ncbi:TonB-dependent receptor plug domain-containing protein [Aurantiacibacter poecillastricola]|uniref:TonB-dependent receptor plug domain-containing protein n=1 Tax=Aurantiacibacter poecillastricola TaxID=3064385 RepID=UPI00273D5D0C|nr:TonB-dependent receptor plug domain-containing protein [Aurantiacibacter sp. 219JJ12-13]MDP5262777.1 TonB-dependent receptor plug domain-containing protein [Aurantiacibacter sp. 219JJ12-13]
MKTGDFLQGAAALALLGAASPAAAQGTVEDDVGTDKAIAPPPDALDATSGARVFLPADFARFAPRNALDMLEETPGFTIRGESESRGLGQASANVLIDGERITNKSEGVFTQLRRIGTDRVVRIEIVEGASLGVAGLSGQVANVITRPDPLSGRFTYRANFRPKYAEPSFIGGEVSLSGAGETLEWTVALANGVGRGAAGGGNAFIYDPDGTLVERRDIRMQFVGDFPRISGQGKWTSPGGTVVNANASYRRNYENFREDQFRDSVTGPDYLRDFDDRYRGWGYELGGDVSFSLGPGDLKLIGLESYSRNRNRSQSLDLYDDDSLDAGSLFTSLTETGERIGRAEYSWAMLGGDWQLDAEAAFNRLDQSAQLFELGANGEFVELDFPGGTGGVTEDRYEMILTHSRSLASGLSLQIGAGGEYSTIAQTGANGLTRSFWRPKGSVNLAWAVEDGLDISLEAARTVGQLSFGDFLASVSLNQGQANAGNVELKPPQSWEIEAEAVKDLGEWGSTELKVFARFIEDYIEFIPVEGGLETRGNIESARLFGLRWNSTFQLEPIGFTGAQLEVTLQIEESELTDPLTGVKRAFGGIEDRELDMELRHDIPGSDWAWGAGFEYNHELDYYRLGEFGLNAEGPTYTYAFIEHKDVFGMTANFSIFNLTDGRGMMDRYVYDGYRDRSPLLFRETQDLSVQPIFNFRLTGDF